MQVKTRLFLFYLVIVAIIASGLIFYLTRYTEGIILNGGQPEALINQMRLVLICGIILTALVAVVIGNILVNRFVKPFSQLQLFARGIAKGDLSSRVSFIDYMELNHLGKTINSMASQLAESFALIREEKQKLELIISNLVDGILVIDEEQRVVLANPAIENMLGLNFKKAEGRPILEAVLNHHLLELIQEVSESKNPLESELTIYHPGLRQLEIFLAPLEDENQTSCGSIIVIHDVTQVRHLERVRQDFVANVSHELRTPITAIKAMAETLIRGAWQEKEMLLRYLRAIDQESDRLANMVDDLLTLAKLDSKIEVTKESFSLITLIEEVAERFLPVQDLTPKFEIYYSETELPAVYANRNQIKQVLINLLDNAFKYTPASGTVKLTVEFREKRIQVAICDTGIGIPEEDLGRIFERFYRVDKGRSRVMGGTGLGLSIVKHIVESYGSQLEVTSELHLGSCFAFNLPIK